MKESQEINNPCSGGYQHRGYALRALQPALSYHNLSKSTQKRLIVKED